MEARPPLACPPASNQQVTPAHPRPHHQEPLPMTHTPPHTTTTTTTQPQDPLAMEQPGRILMPGIHLSVSYWKTSAFSLSSKMT